MGRAQVSLELLVLVAAFLAFLAAWLPVLGGIKEGAERGIAVSLARDSAARLAGALDDVCMLGEGNARVVEVRLAGGARVEGRGKKVFVVGKDYTVGADRLCSSDEFMLELDGSARLRVSHEGGSVRVEEAGRD